MRWVIDRREQHAVAARLDSHLAHRRGTLSDARRVRGCRDRPLRIVWAVSETTTAAPVDEALESARWDLEPLVEGQGTRARSLLDEAQSRAESFAERYRGKVPELDAGVLAGA